MSRRLLSLLGAGALACLTAFAALSALEAVSPAPNAIQLAEYAPAGEALVHGTGRPFHPSARMPLSSVLAASLVFHARLTPDQAAARYQTACVLLVIALAAALTELLVPGGALFGAAAAAVLFRSGRPFVYFPDSGYAVLLLAVACALAWRARAPSPRRTLALSALIGAGFLYRSPLALLPPLLALYEWAVVHRRSLKRAGRDLLLLCVVPYLFVGPWMLLNQRLLGRPLPFEHGLSPASNIVSGALGLVQGIEGDFAPLVGEPLDGNDTGAVLAWAARHVAAHPARYAAAVLERLAFAFSLHPLLIAAALVALAFFRRRRDVQILGLLAGYYLASFCLMGVLERYFWPLWPLLAALTAAVPAALWSAPKGAERSASPGPAARAAGAAPALCLSVLLPAAAYADALVVRFALNHPAGAGPDAEDASVLEAQARRHPDDAWLRLELGRAEAARGDDARAAQDLAAAVELSPSDERARLAWAAALDRLGKPAALFLWPGRAGEDPNAVVDRLVLMACSRLRAGDARQVRALLAQAYERWRPDDSFVHGEHGALEREAARKLRESEDGFVRTCVELQGPRPEPERRALLAALSGVVPRSTALQEELSRLARKALPLRRRRQGLKTARAAPDRR